MLLHKDIRSRHSLGMHFATFAGSDVEATEPLLELDQAREKYGVGDWQAEEGFGTLNIGQTAVIALVHEK
jgi:N-acyl-phosphatidylethanolamine-hydrolysing phospholipase D